MDPLSMCVVLTHSRCGVHTMRTQPLKELILTAMLPGFFMPCSRLTATMDGARTLVSAITRPPLFLHFPNSSGFSIFPDCGELTEDGFSKIHCQEIVSGYSFLRDESNSSLYFRKDFQWEEEEEGGHRTEFPLRKGQSPSWKGCSVATIQFRKGTQWRMFSLTRYSQSWHLERQQPEILTSSFYQECWSRPVTHAAVARFTAKWLSDVGGCCPFKDFGISAFSYSVRWLGLILLSSPWSKWDTTTRRSGM